MPRRVRLPSTEQAAGLTAALILTAAATAALYFLRDWLETETVALLYLLPVGFSTALWGLWPGIGSAILAFFALNYFFVPPFFTLTVIQPKDLVALAVFLVVAVVISQLLGRARANMASAQSREREAVAVSELAAALVGLRDQDQILRSVGEKSFVAFRAQCTLITLRNEPGRQAVAFRLPASAPMPAARPTISAPIQGMHGLLGEISLWLPHEPAGEAQARMLRTYATQTALALERAALAQAETRARILEQSDALKSAILSSVSHELRTPLATIKASVSSLRSGEVDWESEARLDLLAAVEEETDLLNHLVGNLLDSSRLEAGSLRPQRSWNVLAEIVRSVIVRMKTALRRNSLEVDVSEDLPLVPVDFVQLEQVFANLISNSVKYSPPGTLITIRATADEPGRLRVEVGNEGPQVREEDLERIFDRFYRVTAADRVMGTGLGLSICKGIVEAHGGRIWAQNVPGGLVFVFTLPLVLDGAAPLAG